MAGEDDEARHDPGDSVPEGVAPRFPPPPSKEDLAVKRKLEQLGRQGDKPPQERKPEG